MSMAQTLKKAHVKHLKKDYKGAEKLYKEILNIRPDHLDANYLLGTLFAESGDFTAAEKYLKHAQQLEPLSPFILINLGNVYKVQQKYDQAKQCYESALQRNANLPQACLGLGTLLEMTGENPELQIELFSRSLTYGQNIPEVHQKIGRLLLQSNNKECLKHFETAVQLDPNLKRIYQDLTLAFQRFGSRDDLVTILRKARISVPQNEELEYFAAIALGETPGRELQNKYVKEEFDRYADSFDNSLVDKLGYRLPSELCGMLQSVCGAGMHFKAVADLGCGTGLSGIAIRGYADYLVGIDISERMVEIARQRNYYDKLYNGDIVTVLDEIADTFDLFIATDVLVYIGEIGEFVEAVKKRSSAGALLVFSVESHSGDGVIHQLNGRFAHTPQYVRGVAEKAGCRIISETGIQLRKEYGEWVAGDVYILGMA